MTDQQKAALLNARAAIVMAKALGMHALNLYRDRQGNSIAYDDAAFIKMIEDEGLGWNDIQPLTLEEGR